MGWDYKVPFHQCNGSSTDRMAFVFAEEGKAITTDFFLLQTLCSPLLLRVYWPSFERAEKATVEGGGKKDASHKDDSVCASEDPKVGHLFPSFTRESLSRMGGSCGGATWNREKAGMREMLNPAPLCRLIRTSLLVNCPVYVLHWSWIFVLRCIAYGISYSIFVIPLFIELL